MEELDAELLAVTERQKGPGQADLSDNSASSAAESDGLPESDAGEDDDDDDDDDLDDPPVSDDEDDDVEFGIDDDDDDDYRQKSRRKKKPPAPKKSKSRAKQPKKKKAPRQRAPAAMPSDDDDSEDTFEYKYDKNGYGDDDDRDRLMRMNEVERETLLMERVEARNKEYEIWKMGRNLKARQSGKPGASNATRTARSSGRSKASSKSDALQALAEDKRKKTSRAFEEVSDADSEVEGRSRRDRREERERAVKDEAKEEAALMVDDDGPEMQYSDLVKVGKAGERSTTPLFLRRDTLINLSQQPYFARFVVGLFARIRVEGSRYSEDGGSYLICRIAGVDTGKVYDLASDVRTNYVLVLQIGKQKRPIRINMTSGSHPSEREFGVYRARALDAGVDMPRREEVNKLFKKTNELFFERKVVATDEENKKHIANMEILYPSRVNWTQKRTEARTALDIKRQELSSSRRRGMSELEDKLAREVKELEERLSEIEANEEKYGMSQVKSEDVFHGLAMRNMALNKANEQLMARQRNLESETGGIDPFARFDTTGQSYYSITKKGESGNGKPPEQKRKQLSQSDWRSCLKSWRPDAKRRKISDHPLNPLFGGEIFRVDVFEKESSGGNDVPRRPPRVDSVYAGLVRSKVRLPPNAKVMNFDDWSKMRGM